MPGSDSFSARVRSTTEILVLTAAARVPVATHAEFLRACIPMARRDDLALAGNPGQPCAQDSGHPCRGLRTLTPAQDREIRRMHDSGDYNIAEIAALFNISRPTGYRSLEQTAALPALPTDTRPEPDVAKYDQLLTHTSRDDAG